MTSEWIARESKGRMLCGRQVDGRYVCTESVGEVRDLDRLERQIVLPDGWVRDETSGYFRLTARVKRKLRDPRDLRSPGVRRAGGDGPLGPRRSSTVVMAPTRVQCPRCEEFNTLLPLWLDGMLER
jgi:hypothetical protein